MRWFFLVALAIGCAPAPPAKHTPLILDAPRVAGPMPLMVIQHSAFQGLAASIAVYREGRAILLHVSRQCVNRCMTDWTVRLDDTSAVEPLLAVLDPSAIPEDLLCERSQRDGAYWSVAARVHDEPVYRSVPADDPGGACDPVARAFVDLAWHAGLRCDRECLRHEEWRRRNGVDVSSTARARR